MASRVKIVYDPKVVQKMDNFVAAIVTRLSKPLFTQFTWEDQKTDGYTTRFPVMIGEDVFSFDCGMDLLNSYCPIQINCPKSKNPLLATIIECVRIDQMDPGDYLVENEKLMQLLHPDFKELYNEMQDIIAKTDCFDVSLDDENERDLFYNKLHVAVTKALRI